MKADGFSLDDKRVVVSENDITDIIKRFKNREQEIDRKRTEQSFMVPKQEIADNGYDLSINKYKQVEYEKIEYPATSEILANIKALDKEIAKLAATSDTPSPVVADVTHNIFLFSALQRYCKLLRNVR